MPKKYRRRENGAGTVTKLSGNRRKPWVAKTSATEDEEGNFVRKVIGYYETRQEARDALEMYRLMPQSPKVDMTLEELHEEWTAVAYRGIAKETKYNYEVAWKHMKKLYKLKVKDIRSGQLQAVVDDATRSGLGNSSVEKIKTVMIMLEDYAKQNDIINKNYAKFVKIDKKPVSEKPFFSETQVKAIQKGADEGIGISDLILVMIYTGWRIQEFVNLTIFDYDRQNKTMHGGLKTEAGKDRLVPVSAEIEQIVNKYADMKGPALFCWTWNNGGRPENYREELRPYNVKSLRERFYDTLKELGIQAPEGQKFVPHSTRHTCNTRMKKNGVPKSTRMKILGQVDEKTNDRVYTHTDLEEMHDAVKHLYA